MTKSPDAVKNRGAATDTDWIHSRETDKTAAGQDVDKQDSKRNGAIGAARMQLRRSRRKRIPSAGRPVSYTHLTLPTICSV